MPLLLMYSISILIAAGIAFIIVFYALYPILLELTFLNCEGLGCAPAILLGGLWPLPWIILTMLITFPCFVVLKRFFKVR